MAHYFSPDQSELKSSPKAIHFAIGGQSYDLTTEAGVFSKQGLDFGSRLLLESIELPEFATVLDLGCGYGPIGIVCARRFHAKVWMADINERAVSTAKANAKANRVEATIVVSDGFSNIEGTFDYILTNPPIRAGKATIYGWFARARDFLNAGGFLVLVIRKDQGAASAEAELRRLYEEVEIIGKKSGYFVFRCRLGLTN
jgi:16S rRNA (guanine1207-N2)-methyltransferase